MSETAISPELHELPDDWRWARLADICDPLNGRGFKKTEWRDSGLPIIRIQNLKDPNAAFNYFDGGLSDNHKVESGDLLFAWSGTPGTSFGAHIWRGEAAALNQHIFNVKFDPKVIDPKYFCYAINQNVTRYVAQAQGGVGLAHITKGKFLDSSVPLAPRDQQDRIVAEIEKQFSRLDEAVASLKRVKANLKRYKDAVLKAAVEGKLTEEWRKQNPGVELASQLLERILAGRRTKWEETELAKMKAKGKEPRDDKWKSRYKVQALPEGMISKREIRSWTIASAAQIAEHIVDGTHHTPTYIELGVDFISAKDIKSWTIDFTQCRNIPQEEHNKLINRCHPKPGHVLVTKSGTIGRVAVVQTKRPFSLFESVALIPCLDGVDPNYIAYVVHSEVMGEFGRKSQKGVAVRHLHLEDLRLLPIPIPPADEQREIVAIVSQKLSLIESLDAASAVAIKRTERMRQSMLAAAFGGTK